MQQEPTSSPAPPSKVIYIDVLRRLGVPEKYLDNKRNNLLVCPHKESCLVNAVQTAATSFKYGFILRAVISFFGALMQIKAGNRNPNLILQVILGKDNWIFASFLALYPLINKGLLCSLRNYRGKNCGFQDFITGAIAGSISVSILPGSLRFILTLYLFTRALESIYRHFAMKNGRTVGKWDYVLLFSVCCGLIGYAFAFEPDLMPPSLVKIYLRFANMDTNDMIFRDAWIAMAKKRHL